MLTKNFEIMQFFKSIFVVCIIFTITTAIGQGITCQQTGIQYVYDNAGNRTKRIYYVRNCDTPPPSEELVMAAKKYETDDAENVLNANNAQWVDAIYPNPTTDIFYVTFENALKNAIITIVAANGNIVKQLNANGFKQTIDISTLANGTYYLNIKEGKRVVSKKIIKL